MFKAVTHNKDGGWWRGITKSEDLLSSMVLSRLVYLDGETLWGVLRQAFRPEVLPPRQVVRLVSAEFWPDWPHPDPDLLRVEPDAVLHFEIGDPAQKLTVIIEAKIPPGLQHAEQWAREWLACGLAEEERAAEEGTERVVPARVLLALGGLLRGGRERTVREISQAAGAWITKPRDVPLRIAGPDQSGVVMQAAAADWSDLLPALEAIGSEDPAQARIRDDIVEALALYGYLRLQLLDELVVDFSEELEADFDGALPILAPFEPVASLEPSLVEGVAESEAAPPATDLEDFARGLTPDFDKALRVLAPLRDEEPLASG